jgi:hypothetical protein
MAAGRGIPSGRSSSVAWRGRRGLFSQRSRAQYSMETRWISPRSIARNTADAISSRSSSDFMRSSTADSVSSNADMTCDSVESTSPCSSPVILVLPWIVNPFMLARSTPLLAKVIPSTTPHCRNVMTSQGEFPASDLINEKAAGPSVGSRPVLRVVVLRDWPGVYVPGSRCRQRFGLFTRPQTILWIFVP